MCDYWEDDETHCEKMQQKKTTPTTQHSYFHFCTFLSCYWFLKWPELTEIPQCSLEINSWFLSRRNCLHGRKGRRGKKTHLAIWSNFFLKDSINRACNEILSSFFLFCHNYSLNFGGTEVLGLAFWILSWESPSPCHRIREKETNIQVGLFSPSSTVLLSTRLSTRNEQMLNLLCCDKSLNYCRQQHCADGLKWLIWWEASPQGGDSSKRETASTLDSVHTCQEVLRVIWSQLMPSVSW